MQDCGNLELIKKFFFLCLFEVTSCVIETDRAYRIMLLKEWRRRHFYGWRKILANVHEYNQSKFMGKAHVGAKFLTKKYTHINWRKCI